VIAREVVEPGGAAHDAVLERFAAVAIGDGGLSGHSGGGIDRAALAEIVFGDPAALADLNAIVHPAVRAVVARRLEQHTGTDHVVVVDVPLLVEAASDYPIDGVVVVDCPEDMAVARLVGLRGMDEFAARRRVAAQASRPERLAHADFVILNDGTLADLESQADSAWSWIQSLNRSDPRPGVE